MPGRLHTIDTTPRPIFRPPSLELNLPSFTGGSEEQQEQHDHSQTEYGGRGPQGSESTSASSSGWHPFFSGKNSNNSVNIAVPPSSGLQKTTAAGEAVQDYNPRCSTAEEEGSSSCSASNSTRADTVGDTANSSAAATTSTVSSDSNRRNPLKQSKHRQTQRRWRFRQGVHQAGITLGVLTEGDVETERTSHITEENFDADFEEEGHSFWQSACCQLALVSLLCFVFISLVTGVAVYILGGFSSSSTSSDPQERTPSLPVDWAWDPSILEGPVRPVRALLPSFTLAAMEADPEGPQARAVAWIENHPLELAMKETFENWKKVQLVALASFFYAFNGKDWPEDKKKDWLSYDKDECSWGDPGEDGKYIGVSCHMNDPRKVGRFRELNLDWFLGFGLVGFPDEIEGSRMPPEVVFLTHLESLGLLNCGLSAVLTQLLPPTLPQLPSLTRLSYRFNNIKGTIPAMIGALTNLKYLSFGSNYVTGSLPKELGGLTNMEELFLYSNELQGSMPTELARLTKLREFSAISNGLTGSIPEAVGNWEFLQFFFVDHNPMTGVVPSGICQLPNMTAILVPCTIDCGSNCGDLCECF